MRKTTTWITGASGLLGSAVVDTAPAGTGVVALRLKRPLPDHLRRKAQREISVDLSDAEAVDRLADEQPPSSVIHCAALTSGAECEANPDVAIKANVQATTNVVAMCRAYRVPIVHCSTDLVFDGHNGPYVEDDDRSPVGVYAETKVQAEDVARAYDKALVVRLPIMLGISPAGSRSTDEWIGAALKAKRPFTLFVDEYRTPIHTHLAASIIWELLHKGVRGLVHLAGATRVSRWDLGMALAGRLQLSTDGMRQGSVADFTGSPPRCPDVSLRTEKLAALLGRPAPSVADSLAMPLAGE